MTSQSMLNRLENPGEPTFRRGAVVGNGPTRNLGVDECRPISGERLGIGGLELPERFHPEADRATGPCIGGVVRVLEFDQTVLAIGEKLISLDKLELAVVEDDPDDRDVVLDGRHQLETRQIVAAVTAPHNDSAVRMCELQAQGTVDVSRHGAEASGLAEVLAFFELDVIAHPCEMRSGIGKHDASRRQHSADGLRQLAGMDIADDVRDVACLIVAPVNLSRRPLLHLRLECGVERYDRGLDIRDDRRIGLVDLVNLRFGDVDVDELLAVEEVVTIIECCMLVERITDGEYDVRFEERFPRTGVATVAENANREGVVFADDALAVQGRDKRSSDSAR